MPNRLWLDDLRDELRRRKLPTDYIRRFMDELSDHFADLLEESESMDANAILRLGRPDQVAEAAEQSYKRSGFLGRHPTAKFGLFAVSPIIALVFSMAAALLVTIGVVNCFDSFVKEQLSHYSGPVAETVAGYLFSSFFVILPSVALGVLYCRLTKRFHVDARWALASCAVLAFMAFGAAFSAKLVGVPGQNAIQAGFSIGGMPSVLQIIQMTVPLVVGIWYFVRRRREASQELAA